MDDEDTTASDVHTRVLQTTLDEISAQRTDTDKSEPESLCCVICLDVVSEGCVAQPCAHRNFDFLCLASWLQERPSCPLCQAEVRDVQYDFSPDLREWKTFHVPAKEPEKKAADAAPRSFPSVNPRPTPRPWASRRRRDPPPSLPVPADEAILRRRHVYRNKLYSLHVGTNRYSRYQELSPQLFASDAELLSKARKWIRRELQVFEFLSATPAQGGRVNDAAASTRRVNNAEFLLEYIVAILKTIDIQGSCGQAEDMLQEFLGRDNTRLFLHELRAWLRSPYTSLESWDRNVQYDESKARPTIRDEQESDGGALLEGSRSSRPHPREQSLTAARGGSHWRPSPHRYKPYHRRQEPTTEDRRREASRRHDPS